MCGYIFKLRVRTNCILKIIPESHKNNLRVFHTKSENGGRREAKSVDCKRNFGQ